ncbi:MAG: hypothetical protein R6V54_02030, partial [Desulfobacteraceae bacterium]
LSAVAKMGSEFAHCCGNCKFHDFIPYQIFYESRQPSAVSHQYSANQLKANSFHSSLWPIP